MRQDFFEFTPQFKLFVTGNHKPGLRNVDEAIRRRLNYIPFTVIIPEANRDPMLAEKLKPEWPGILQWMNQQMAGRGPETTKSRRGRNPRIPRKRRHTAELDRGQMRDQQK